MAKVTISIHAPLAGCDHYKHFPCRRQIYFNPRTPCGVRRAFPAANYANFIFQSTHPLRGATHEPKTRCVHQWDFNPRTPCGVRHSLHALRTCADQFQSTHPLRGATGGLYVSSGILRNFNPRTPCGVRRRANWRISDDCRHFNPRTPCGVRRCRSDRQQQQSISIHAPLAGCDLKLSAAVLLLAVFQSTHPLRGATELRFSGSQKIKFQSTHPLRGATTILRYHGRKTHISIHAPLAGCDCRAVKARGREW